MILASVDSFFQFLPKLVEEKVSSGTEKNGKHHGKTTPWKKLPTLVYIQSHPSVLIWSTVHHEAFTAGTLEALVCRTSAFRAPAGKTEFCYTPTLKYPLLTVL